ncbi:MAG TPA: GNAT family N-acetyltransferase [Gammaproteobacteria bacterium]|nr:GNAT family N-acetyltransferase [Gammaproteobacteria bacterium]
MKKTIRIERVSWQSAESELRTLREAIFINEQQVPEELEWDGRDDSSSHVLAFDEQNRPIGTGRLQPDGHIGRMAVLPPWRHQGVGSALLTALIAIAQKMRLPSVELDAQTQAVGFYRRHGFQPIGDVFMDAGILHQRMQRELSGSTAEVPEMALDLSAQTLGESRDILYLRDRADNRDVALRLVQQAHRSLHLFTQDLDPALFDTREFVEAVKQLAIHSTRSKVYILLKDPTTAITRGHRIVELARRISSHVFIHRAAEEDQDRIDSFMVVDEVGILRRAHGSRFEGTAEFNNPGEARQLLKSFNDAWERSVPEAELRRLHI